MAVEEELYIKWLDRKKTRGGERGRGEARLGTVEIHSKDRKTTKWGRQTKDKRNEGHTTNEKEIQGYIRLCFVGGAGRLGAHLARQKGKRKKKQRQ